MYKVIKYRLTLIMLEVQNPANCAIQNIFIFRINKFYKHHKLFVRDYLKY